MGGVIYAYLGYNIISIQKLVSFASLTMEISERRN
jgi:hypothetical protein